MRGQTNVPLEPLFDLLAGRGHHTIHDASRAVGADWSGFHRATQRGSISIWNADQIATRLGLHPVHIWGNEWPLIHVDTNTRTDWCDRCRRQIDEATPFGQRLLCRPCWKRVELVDRIRQEQAG